MEINQNLKKYQLFEKYAYNFKILLDSEEWENIKGNNEDTLELFNMKMEDIKTSVHDVRININKIRHSQYMLGAQMSKVKMIEATNEDLNMIIIIVGHSSG